MSEGFLREIQELKDERKRYATDSGSAVAMVRRECDLELEKNNKTVKYYKQLLKSNETETESHAAKNR